MEHKSKMIYVFDTQSSKHCFEVFSFRKWVHHVHNCWLRSHIEFWILRPTSSDLQLMTFGSKTLMLGCKNRLFWDAKSMILGSEIDLGVLGGIYGPSWPQDHLLGGSWSQSRILGRLLGPLFGGQKRSKSMKNLSKILYF